MTFSEKRVSGDVLWSQLVLFFMPCLTMLNSLLVGIDKPGKVSLTPFSMVNQTCSTVSNQSQLQLSMSRHICVYVTSCYICYNTKNLWVQTIWHLTFLQTSPADGTILHLSEVKNGTLEQVKGIAYSIRGFLGPKGGLLFQK